jgi:hypothetical protein
MKTTRQNIAFKNLSQVKRLIGLKITESNQFAANFVPSYIKTAEDCFMWLKTKTTYLNDPPGIELLQSFQSLILDNYHGVPGAGDCDCLTIAAAATLNTRPRPIPFKIIYCGNGKAPTHVFLSANGTAFDLTTNSFGALRPYKRYDF